jgi:hypothetical protein
MTLFLTIVLLLTGIFSVLAKNYFLAFIAGFILAGIHLA